MSADPHTCPHLNLVYEKVAGGDPFIRCDDCYTTWDADEPLTEGLPPIAETEHYDITAEDYPADWEVKLNPDNEPTSEHMQWRKDNESED